MSTKIYSAYKWNSSMEQLLDYLKKFRDEVLTEAILKILYENNEFFEKSIMEFINSRKDNKDFIDRNHIKFFHIREFLDHTCKMTTNNLFNFRSSVAIYVNKNKIGVHFFCDEAEPNHKYLVDYHYQDQTDKPKHISKIEWKQREKFWNNYTWPLMDAFQFELTGSYQFIYNIANIYSLFYNTKNSIRKIMINNKED